MIIADKTETRSWLPKLLKKYGVKVTFDSLDVGDYIIIGPTRSAGVSSKSAEDFISSIENDHLNDELLHLSSNYTKSVFIVHGSIDNALVHRKMSRQIYGNYIAGIVSHESPFGVMAGVSVVNFPSSDPAIKRRPTSGVYDAVQFLKSLHDIITQDDIYRKPTALKIKYPPEYELTLSIRYMLKPAGVGMKRAKQIQEKFGSIQNVVNAKKEQFMSIDGIGEKIADSIVEYVRRE